MSQRIYPNPGDRHVGIQGTIRGFSVILYEWIDEPVTFNGPHVSVTSNGQWKIVSEYKDPFKTRESAVYFGKEWADIEACEFREFEKL